MASLSETLPLKRNENMGDFEETNTPSSCGCFEKLCFGWSTKRDESMDSLLAHRLEETRETWFTRSMKEVQHVSEVLGGPKWKNFIRSSGPRGVGQKRKTLFRYDPRSYALNFDDGLEREESLHPRF
ncbi:uncharacterized protein LOC115753735 [Rhodamnia argentea]|uniref:Uncharacterized protein LOC115753735 n=1 Tax=Rhodamnia argentea TaxID=178133 RepID=A0A8B8QPG6_9MYRT|nr:uncharacterized protein LOC115753735 [Rhodamnia argentea]